MNIADVIAAQARARPKALAVATPERAYSYAELEGEVWNATAWLHAQGARSGMVVGVSLPGTTMHLVLALALARLGAVQLGLPTYMPAARRAELAARFGVRLVISGDDGMRIGNIPLSKPHPAWPAAPPDPSLRAPGGDTGWKIVLTSGTTGAPKAVLQTHAMHLAWRDICQAAIPARPDDRYLAAVDVSFHAGFLRCANLFHAGGAVLLEFPHRTNGDALALLERERVTYAQLNPIHVSGLLSIPGDHRDRLRAIRILRCGTMTVPERLRREIVSRLSPNLLVVYGSNDGGTPIAVARAQDMADFPGCIGRASPGVEIQVVDEADRQLSPGETGAIRVRAAGLPAAYLDDPGASALAYRGGWYYPGDVGSLVPGGILYFKGRRDERMNYDGLKVYPAEIESALLDHPAIAEAAAFPLPSDVHENVPAAAVVLQPTRSVESDELRRWCAERLGSRAPRFIVLLPALPRNERGKVQRQELVRIAQQRLTKKQRPE